MAGSMVERDYGWEGGGAGRKAEGNGLRDN